MSIFKEYNIVLENAKLKEDLGIESLIFANHLNTQISTQNVSSISSRKSQIPESGS